MSGPLCPACHLRRKYRDHYLCSRCWFALPFDTRRLLWRRDQHARGRLLSLLQAIHRNIPLRKITPEVVNQ